MHPWIHGPACSECSEGYGRTGGDCVPCSTHGIPQISYLVVRIGLLVFAITSIWLAVHRQDFAAKLDRCEHGLIEVWIQQAQLLSVICAGPAISLPSALLFIAALCGAASGTPSYSLSSSYCVWRSLGTSTHEYINTLAVLLQALVLLPLVAVVLVWVDRWHLRNNRAEGGLFETSANIIAWSSREQKAGSHANTADGITGADRAIPNQQLRRTQVMVHLNPHFTSRRLSKHNDGTAQSASAPKRRRQSVLESGAGGVSTPITTEQSAHPLRALHTPMTVSITLLTLALHYVPSVMFTAPTLLLCTTLLAWSGAEDGVFGGSSSIWNHAYRK